MLSAAHLSEGRPKAFQALWPPPSLPWLLRRYLSSLAPGSLPSRLATLSLHSPTPTLTIRLGAEEAPCREYLLSENALKGKSFLLIPRLGPRTALFFPW